jgi:hypothetical protein
LFVFLFANKLKISHNTDMNNNEKGTVRCIVFRDGALWYAVGLEFNIVESSDDPVVAWANLDNAMRGYVESQKKIKGSRLAPLNQKADKDYEDLWRNLTSKKSIPSPYEVKYFGVAKV